jgi:AAA15 family ATPase/GTPase
MLVNFHVENFKSFKEFTEFSMEATKLKNLKESNTFDINNISLLKSAVVYGANASGKSNFLYAMKEMKNIITSSLDIQTTYQLNPFLLNVETEKKPTVFEIEIIVDDKLFRYGFSISKDALILEEWLYQKKLQSRSRETFLFKRIRDEITLNSSFKEGKGIKDKTRSEVLFLSVVANFNGKISKSIILWFLKNFMIISGLKDDTFKYLSIATLDDNDHKDEVNSFIKSADLGISDLVLKRSSFEEFAKKSFNQPINSSDTEKLAQVMRKMIEDMEGREVDNKELPKQIQTQHIQYDKNNKFSKYITFDVELESDGTQRFIAFSGPITWVLSSGGVLIIDELDNSLHTELVRAIIKLFNSKETNPNGAQLIFTTHDTNLLDQKIFRRDQIWFTQKDIYGASELYSLIEYGKGKTRDDLALEKNYLEGKFGAKPHVGSLMFEVD